MINIQEVSSKDLAFGGDIKKLLPKWNDIPDEYKNGHTKWNNVVSMWFYGGLKNPQWKPKDGIETVKALRHIKAILTSWEPKHEHKEAGCAYLLSQWFKDVEFEKM